MGHASLTVSMTSARQTARCGGAAGVAAAMVLGNVIARHHSGRYGNRKARHADSAVVGCDEELAIALAAQDGRGHDAYDTPAARPDEGGDIVADRGVNERIVHDAFFHLTSAALELRLDQRQEMRRRSRECERRRQDELERDETRVDDDEVGPLGKPRHVEDANVGSFHGYDLCSPPQAWPRPPSTA